MDPAEIRQAVAGLMLTAILFASAAAWSGFRWRNEAVMADMLDAQARQDWRGMLAAGERLDRRFVDMTVAGAPVDWHLGLARWQVGDSAGAQADFRAALALHPWHTHVLYDLSVARLASGDAAEAASLLRRSLATSPGFAPAAMNLAVIELRRGHVEAGHAALAQVAERRRDGHWHRIDAALTRAKGSME